jgi:hypothetical protein
VELDSHADICCADTICCLVKESGEQMNVYIYSKALLSQVVTIVTAATTTICPITGQTIILILTQMLIFDHQPIHTLLSMRQLWSWDMSWWCITPVYTALWLYLFTLVPFEWDIPNGQQLLLQLEGVTIFCESQADPWGIGLFMTGLTSYRSRIRDQMLLLRMGLPLPWAPFLSSHLRHWLQYWLLIIWWA